MFVRTVVPEYARGYAGYGGAGTGWLGTENRSAASVASSALGLVWCCYPRRDLSPPELLVMPLCQPDDAFVYSR